MTLRRDGMTTGRLRPPPPRGRVGRPPGRARRAFSLVELLVVIAIILGLIAMTAAAVSGARGNQRRQATLVLIEKLDAIVMQHYAGYGGRVVPTGVTAPAGMSGAIHRSWYIRRHMINGDLPDRWVDVQYMYDNSDLYKTPPPTSPQFPKERLSPHQRSYLSTWHAMTTKPSAQYQGAECLFMIIMQGGIASCLDCNDVRDASVGDKDGDGAFEFWDAWGNPIEYLLWPAALELPAGSGEKFFTGKRALQIPFPTEGPSPSPGLGMRPLIYSPGPDGEYGLETQAATANLSCNTQGASPVGRDCGNWQASPAAIYGNKVGTTDTRVDNVTNLDLEVNR